MSFLVLAHTLSTRRTITTEMDTEVVNISVGWCSQFWKAFMMNFAS